MITRIEVPCSTNNGVICTGCDETDVMVMSTFPVKCQNQKTAAIKNKKKKGDKPSQLSYNEKMEQSHLMAGHLS